jgi:hypothetical protein
MPVGPHLSVDLDDSIRVFDACSYKHIFEQASARAKGKRFPAADRQRDRRMVWVLSSNPIPRKRHPGLNILFGITLPNW